MAEPTYTISHPAYLKIFFHAAKHPHKQVNGVLLGKAGNSHTDTLIVDAVPLLHHWTSLSPMMEIGLDLAKTHADSLGLSLVGYYQACERLDDTALAPVGEKIAEIIRKGYPKAIAFVIDGEELGTEKAALIPYIPAASSTWRPSTTTTMTPFISGSPYQLASVDSPIRAVAHVRDDRLHHKFGDFDDHLEDVSIDWLRNRACMPTATS